LILTQEEEQEEQQQQQRQHKAEANEEASLLEVLEVHRTPLHFNTLTAEGEGPIMVLLKRLSNSK